jgi:hypothetical protein
MRCPKRAAPNKLTYCDLEPIRTPHIPLPRINGVLPTADQIVARIGCPRSGRTAGLCPRTRALFRASRCRAASMDRNRNDGTPWSSAGSIGGRPLPPGQSRGAASCEQGRPRDFRSQVAPWHILRNGPGHVVLNHRRCALFDLRQALVTAVRMLAIYAIGLRSLLLALSARTHIHVIPVGQYRKPTLIARYDSQPKVPLAGSCDSRQMSLIQHSGCLVRDELPRAVSFGPYPQKTRIF